AIPVHGRAFPAQGSVEPKIQFSHCRLIGEERPIEPFEDRVQQCECNTKCKYESPHGGTRVRHRCRRIHRMGTVELRQSLAYTHGPRHDPIPRKSLATWPAPNAYHTVTARKTVSHLRTATSSSDSGCRQRNQ